MKNIIIHKGGIQSTLDLRDIKARRRFVKEPTAISTVQTWLVVGGAGYNAKQPVIYNSYLTPV
jgi:hypothetical protein